MCLRPYKDLSIFIAVFAVVSVILTAGLSGQMVSAQTSPDISAQMSTAEQQALANIPKTTIPIAVTVTPEYPGAFTQTSVSINSYSTDLDSAEMTWSVDGRVVQSGIGQKDLTVTTGKLGSLTDIEIKIRTEEGDIVVQSVPIRPESVDVVWEGDTYAPPFYEGKTLFTAQSKVNVVALPDIIDSSGNKIDPNNLIYKWKVNDEVQQQSSGYGKNTFVFTGPTLLKPSDIVVDVSSLDGSIAAEGTLTLTESQPQVVFYEDDPLYGILFGNALVNSYNLPDKEVDIAAIPYFFSTPTKDSSAIKYSWEINGQPIAATSSPQSDLTFRNEQNLQGSSNISLQIDAVQSVFQTATNNLNINFDTTKSGF